MVFYLWDWVMWEYYFYKLFEEVCKGLVELLELFKNGCFMVE